MTDPTPTVPAATPTDEVVEYPKPAYDDPDSSKLLRWMGLDARRWAEAFNETQRHLGQPEIDYDHLFGWFANAIMAGYDTGRAPFMLAGIYSSPDELILRLEGEARLREALALSRRIIDDMMSMNDARANAMGIDTPEDHVSWLVSRLRDLSAALGGTP